MTGRPHMPNELLRAARNRFGLSRDDLADRCNREPVMAGSTDGPVTANLIGKLEQGRVRFPNAERRAALRAVLGVATDTELGLVKVRRRPTDIAAARPPAAERVLATTEAAEERGIVVPSGPPDLLARVEYLVATTPTLLIGDTAYHRLIDDLAAWASRMNRRDVLQWLSCAAAAAAAAPLITGLDPDERLRVGDVVTTRRRVDSTVVDHIDAVLWRGMRQDDTLGPQTALDTVLAQRTLVRGLLPEAAGALHRRMLSLYADLSRFAGWLTFDLGDYPVANSYYETARSAAHEAENTELGAFVLCNLSHLATWRGQSRLGIDHALAAQGWAVQSDDRHLQAYAHDVAARAFAKDGRHQAALHALDQAQETLAQATTDSKWVYFYTEAQLGSTRSTCMLDLGRPEQAVDSAQHALDSIDASFVRNLAITCINLGVARLRTARPDVIQGCIALDDAVRLTAHNRSARVTQLLHDAAADLLPWQRHPQATATLRAIGSPPARP